MDLEKIGKYIKHLREQNNWTQEELAEKLTIGRTAVSKWERGATIPDPSILIRLSELFNISINEILNGQSYKNDNSSKNDGLILGLYRKNFKNRKVIKILSILVIVTLVMFLFYYFFTSYKSTSVYNISGTGKNISISNGFLIYTREKHYFSIGNINNSTNDEILKLELYIKYKNNQLKLLNSVDDKYLFVAELNGYDEFELKNFIKTNYKTYIKIYYGDTSELIELEYIKDYINDYFIPFKAENASDDSVTQKIEEVNYNEISVVLTKLKNNLNKDYDNNYSKSFKYKNNSVIISYNVENEILNLIFENKNKVTETWNYNLDLNNLTYNNDSMSYLFNKDGIQCLNGNCDNWKQKNDMFWEIVLYVSN